MTDPCVVVREFRVGDKLYIHRIYYCSDDRIELVDDKGEVVLTYTASCEVKEGRGGKIIAHCRPKGVAEWVIETEDGRLRATTNANHAEALLEAEVAFSKLYLEQRQ